MTHSASTLHTHTHKVAQQDDATAPAPPAKKRKTVGRSCGTCGRQGHTSSKCPDLESAAPDTPDPDIVVDAGQPIGVLDTEFSTAKKGEDTVVHEAALVVAT